MTAYSVSSGSSTSAVITIAPVTFEVRIITTFAFGTSSGGGSSVSSIPTNGGLATSTTGGTTVTPTPIRTGSVASSSTCKNSFSTITGQQVLYVALASGSGGSITGPTGLTTYGGGGAASWSPPVDIIVSPGQIFWAQMNAADGNGAVICWFEELRLSWPY